MGGSPEGRIGSVDRKVERGSAAGVAVPVRDAGGSSESSD